MSDVGALPFVDEHSVLVPAGAEVVWRALGASLARRGAVGRAGARLLGTDPAGSVGDPLVAGSALPGFAVVDALPGRRLVLAGRHRFSDYALVFTLEDRTGATRLSARTRARFPGLRGRAYRALVIGSGAHRVLVRRWLGRIGAAAEARA